MAKTWVLTGSLDNFRTTREHGFRVIGAKERRRRMAEQIEPGDRIVLYVTGLQAFGAIVRVTGAMYEDRTRLWPGKVGRPDPYPWRFETEPEVVLDEDDFVPAGELAADLEHVRKWPAEHWQLAFQGQLRTVSESDAALRAPARRRRSSSFASASETVRSWPWNASVQCSAGHLRTCSSSLASSSAGTRSLSSRTSSGSVSNRHGYASTLPGLPGQTGVRSSNISPVTRTIAASSLTRVR